jgi:hypothetical protein
MCKKNCQRFGHIRAAILRLSCLNWTAWQVPQTTQMSFGDRRETYTIAHKKGRPLRVFLFYSSPCRTGRLIKNIILLGFRSVNSKSTKCRTTSDPTYRFGLLIVVMHINMRELDKKDRVA